MSLPPFPSQTESVAPPRSFVTILDHTPGRPTKTQAIRSTHPLGIGVSGSPTVEVGLGRGSRPHRPPPGSGRAGQGPGALRTRPPARRSDPVGPVDRGVADHAGRREGLRQPLAADVVLRVVRPRPR